MNQLDISSVVASLVRPFSNLTDDDLGKLAMLIRTEQNKRLDDKVRQGKFPMPHDAEKRLYVSGQRYEAMQGYKERHRYDTNTATAVFLHACKQMQQSRASSIEEVRAIAASTSTTPMPGSIRVSSVPAPVLGSRKSSSVPPPIPRPRQQATTSDGRALPTMPSIPASKKIGSASGVRKTIIGMIAPTADNSETTQVSPGLYKMIHGRG